MSKDLMDGRVFVIVTSTKTTTELSKEFGIDYSEVSKLRRDKKYKHLWHLRREIHNR